VQESEARSRNSEDVPEVLLNEYPCLLSLIMAKPTYKRSVRVGDQMKQEIADILMKKIKDPRIGFVTVTDVDLSDDLRNAKVFVSIYGGDKIETLKGLKSAAPFIRSELGRRMTMRCVPEILFRYDSTVEQGAHIMELLHEIEKKQNTEEKETKDPEHE